MVICEVNNIKASCKVQGKNISSKLKVFEKGRISVTKRKSNFFVLRDKFVYIIFYTGHVNITGVRSRDTVNEARVYLSVLIKNLDLTLSQSVIDNICLSGSLSRGLNLVSFSDQLQQDCVSFCYNPRKFPGLSFPSTNNNSGTTIVFTSGKFIIVGLKHEDAILDAESRLIELIGRSTQY